MCRVETHLHEFSGGSYFEPPLTVFCIRLLGVDGAESGEDRCKVLERFNHSDGVKRGRACLTPRP